jgi:hypothetical protein
VQAAVFWYPQLRAVNCCDHRQYDAGGEAPVDADALEMARRGEPGAQRQRGSGKRARPGTKHSDAVEQLADQQPPPSPSAIIASDIAGDGETWYANEGDHPWIGRKGIRVFYGRHYVGKIISWLPATLDAEGQVQDVPLWKMQHQVISCHDLVAHIYGPHIRHV